MIALVEDTMLKQILFVSALFLVLAAGYRISSAQTTQPSPSSTLSANDANISNGPGTPFDQRYPRYQVMPSDVLSVSFPLIPEIQPINMTVQPDGFIMLPNAVGTFYVKGDTVPQIVDLLTHAYSKTMHNPIVAVQLTNFQPPVFTVNGQVGKPGQYPLRIDTTVSEAIAVAGGFLPTAKTQVFLFHRISTDWLEVKKLNIKQLLNGHKIHEDVHLQPGDMIFVPDKFISNFRKYVPYGLGTGLGFNGNAALLNQ